MGAPVEPHAQEGETFVFHYPRLVIDGPPVAVLGGELTPFSFEEFERLDPDWARRSYFERASPAIWRTGPGYDSGGATLDPTESALLIYHALLMATAADLPDPRLSVCYRVLGGAVERVIGPYERTYLLNGIGEPPVGPEVLAKVAALAERWARGGIRSSDSVFAPLRGLAVAASSAVPPAIAAVPMMVALEGLLLPRQVEGIAREMARSAATLLEDRAPADLDQLVTQIYAWRSDILHGRTGAWTTGTSARLRTLVVALVEAAVERLLDTGRIAEEDDA